MVTGIASKRGATMRDTRVRTQSVDLQIDPQAMPGYNGTLILSFLSIGPCVQPGSVVIVLQHIYLELHVFPLELARVRGRAFHRGGVRKVMRVQRRRLVQTTLLLG